MTFQKRAVTRQRDELLPDMFLSFSCGYATLCLSESRGSAFERDSGHSRWNLCSNWHLNSSLLMTVTRPILR